MIYFLGKYVNALGVGAVRNRAYWRGRTVSCAGLAIINASCYLIVNSWICIFLGVISHCRSAWIGISKPYPHVRCGFANPDRAGRERAEWGSTMLIPTNRGLTCPERTCNELYYYEPNDALNSYHEPLQLFLPKPYSHSDSS